MQTMTGSDHYSKSREWRETTQRWGVQMKPAKWKMIVDTNGGVTTVLVSNPDAQSLEDIRRIERKKGR